MKGYSPPLPPAPPAAEPDNENRFSKTGFQLQFDFEKVKADVDILKSWKPSIENKLARLEAVVAGLVNGGAEKPKPRKTSDAPMQDWELRERMNCEHNAAEAARAAEAKARDEAREREFGALLDSLSPDDLARLDATNPYLLSPAAQRAPALLRLCRLKALATQFE